MQIYLQARFSIDDLRPKHEHFAVAKCEWPLGASALFKVRLLQLLHVIINNLSRSSVNIAADRPRKLYPAVNFRSFARAG